MRSASPSNSLSRMNHSRAKSTKPLHSSVNSLKSSAKSIDSSAKNRSLKNNSSDKGNVSHRQTVVLRFQSYVEDEVSSVGSVEIETSEPNRLKVLRNKIGFLVNNDFVSKFIMFLIIVNSIMLGLATFPFVYDNPIVLHVFELTDRIFLIIFTIELIMQLIYHDIALFKDRWLVFDFVTVISSWVFHSMQGIRAFRIFRSLRLVRRNNGMKGVLQAIVSVLTKLGALCGLLSVIFYVFSVFFTTLFMDLELNYTDGQVPQPDECFFYFQSLHGTLFTLFNIMTLDMWGYIARVCMKERTYAWVPFVLFVFVSSFIIFSLLIAIVCDAVAELHESSREAEQVSKDEVEAEKKQKLAKEVKELSFHIFKLLEKSETMKAA